MHSLDRLREQFSDIPTNIVIKADVLVRGVRITPDLKAAGTTACTTGLTTKLARSMAQSQPPPSQFHFSADDTTVDIKPSETSPYRIERDEAGCHHLYSETQALGEVYFTPSPAYVDRRTSDGQTCDEYLTQRGPSCLFVEPISFCAYVRKGDACRYCLLGPAMELRLRQKHARPVPDFGMVAEAVDIAWEELDIRELKLSGGALYDTHKEALLHIECLETILARVSAPEEITIFSQALEKEDQKRLKDAGATNVCFDLEVWNEELWDRLLPGKAKTVSRKTWMKRLDDAVDVFGRGHVGSNFVSGFECAPRPGFLSQKEALKSYAEGFRELIQRGVVPWFTIWNTHPLVGGFEESDTPPTEFHLQLGAVIHELLEKHGVYRDLGFSKLGADAQTLGLYCHYCYTMQFTRDYPRLIGRETSTPRQRSLPDG